ncbi:hypothetical protein FRB99_005804 [Tulasnella sp. 403]|nr:hypothetical protein FRB99_005804 [Tulasnella sp. 403]
MRIQLFTLLLSVFSVLALPIQLAGDGPRVALNSDGVGPGGEDEEPKLSRWWRRLTPRATWDAGPLLFGSAVGGAGLFAVKKVWEVYKDLEWEYEIQKYQEEHGITPENGGRNITAEIPLILKAIFRNINSLPASNQMLTAEFGKIYPNFVPPNAPPRVIILDSSNEQAKPPPPDASAASTDEKSQTDSNTPSKPNSNPSTTMSAVSSSTSASTAPNVT